MADQFSNEGSSKSKLPGEGLDSAIELNIKTLDSRIYSFQVDKSILVSAFKEKIANEIGVPASQQRLIFRGKVLKDEHLLSDYQVESGHTLHLVARQTQSVADTGSRGPNSNNDGQGNDAGSGNSQNRVGQISHSVVLGTFNVGDPGEGTVPDLSRVIGAVLNSFGVGGQISANGISGMQSSSVPNVGSQTAQGNETVDVSQSNVGGQNQAQTQSGQAFSGQQFQSPSQAMQIPLAAAVPLPSLQLPIPDSLSTLSEFMTRMEQALAQNGYQPNNSSNSAGDMRRPELHSNSQSLRALSIVLRQAEQLLNGRASAALSHVAGRLEQDGASIDPSLRGQIQTESAQVGLAMQHLGALLLELGRTILTLRMGQSPAEASINSGPAVYISPSGPNPIMVQPFPLQTNSLFGGSAAQSNFSTSGPVGVGNAPRSINIHITAGTSLAPAVSTLGGRTGEGTQGERGSGTASGSVRVLPVRNIIAATVPTRSTGVAVSNAAQPSIGVSISHPPPDSPALSSIISDVSSRLRSLVGGMQGQSQPTPGPVQSSGGVDTQSGQPNGMTVNGAGESSVTLPRPVPEGDKKEEDDCVQESKNEAKEKLLSSKEMCSFSTGETSVKSEESSDDAPSSSKKHDVPDSDQAVPLGLGMGSLDRKRQNKQPKPLVKSDDHGNSSTNVGQNLNAEMSGQQLLRCLASRSSATNRVRSNDTQSIQLHQSDGRNHERRPLGQQSSDAQFDTTDAMSQVMRSPALDGLLTGVSEQIGVGSPNVLSNMLQQLTQNPQIMSTVSQIAHQVESQDLGNMFSGAGNGQGGGVDLSRLMQQMLPVVSQVLGRGPTSQPFSMVEPEPRVQFNEGRLSGNENPDGQNVQIDLQEAVQSIVHHAAPGDVFHSIAESAVRMDRNDRSQDILNELSSNEDLVSDYMEMLRSDICWRLQNEHGKDC